MYIITKLELGGAQKVCLNLAKGLKKLGHEPLLLSGPTGPLKEEAKQFAKQFFLNDLTREINSSCVFFKEFICFFTLVGTIKKLKKIS